MRIAPRTMLCGIAWRVHVNVASNRFEELRQLCTAAGDKTSRPSPWQGWWRRECSGAGKLNVPVLEITQAADVGMGSFYNHFATKEELFQAAVQEIYDLHGTLLDRLPPAEDPAETFARSFRLTGRLFRRWPQESRVLLNVGTRLIVSDRGLAPRALRDIKAATHAGRFDVADPELALALAAGALLGLGQLLHDQPERETPRPAIRWPRTCCGATGYRPTRPKTFAADHFGPRRADAARGAGNGRHHNRCGPQRHPQSRRANLVAIAGQHSHSARIVLARVLPRPAVRITWSASLEAHG